MKGIIPPLITPLKGVDQIDEAALARLVEHVLAGGVHGVFILGTTGEGPSLSYSLRRRMVDLTTQIVAGRVPVLVGITDTSFVESIHLAEHAGKAGAQAAVLSTPYYFPAGQTELASYVENLVAESPLPIVLYNIPSLTKVAFEFSTLERLTEQSKIIGLKDSGGDLGYFSRLPELRKMRPDWFFLMGPEVLLAKSMVLGGDGGVSGGANIYPDLFVGMYDAVVAGDSERVSSLQQVIDRLQAIYEVGKYASRFIKATKCAVSLRGIGEDFLAEPFHRFHAPERARVAEVLKGVEAIGSPLGVTKLFGQS